MYESYWGLKARPFDHRADSSFYYAAETQHAALIKLRYALEHGSAAALAGASGTGKTLLLDVLARQLGEQGRIFIRLAFPLLSPAELLGYLADVLADDKLPLSDAARSVDQCLRRLEGSLNRFAAQEKQAVVVVDEAHLISDPLTFEALRLLLNLQSAVRPPLALVLVGQTRLLQTLSRMPSLEDRLTARCLLMSFSADETAAYIVHRLHAAGADREIFDRRATQVVHALAQGIPRRINRLCDLALVVGYAEERQTIAAEQIEAVAEELTGLQRTQINTDSNR